MAGSLNSLEREQFENYFLRTPERERKIRFGKALRRYVSSNAAASPRADPVVLENQRLVHEFRPAPERNWFSFLPGVPRALAYSLAAIVGLAVVGGAWLAVRYSLRPQPPGSVFAVALIPGGTRDTSDQLKKFALPPEAVTLRLKLELAQNDYLSYQAAISDANDKLILRANDLHAQFEGGRPSLVVDLAASLIPPNDYQVKLSGIAGGGQSESVARYSFRVVK